MNVTKRDGSTEAVDLNKILKSLQRATEGLEDVDPMVIAQATIGSLQDNIKTTQIDNVAISLCSGKIAEEPNYGYVAARLLAQTISKEAGRDNTLWQVTESLFNTNQVTKQYRKFVKKHKVDLEKMLDHSRDKLFTYFGLSVIKDRYLLKDRSGLVIERPQHLWMRVAIALSETLEEVKEAYEAISNFNYMPSTPTLFNAGTPHPQMSSCYLMDVQEDSISGIYKTYADAAQLSKWAGGLGISWDEVRATGSFIEGTKGQSTGLIPFLKTLDSSVKAVNQAGKRRGSAAVYLSTWHADIEHFLELRDNTGLPDERTYNLNLANWVPDLFMERVDQDLDWSLFCPNDVPELKSTWGEEFNKVYTAAEQAGKARKVVKARDLYKRMMTTLSETGNGWMSFKDTANRNHPQVLMSEDLIVTSSNLCQEILEVRDYKSGEVAVCNLGSIVLSKFVSNSNGYLELDEAGLRSTVRVAVKLLDRVIDRNFYPLEGAKRQNDKWRNIGLGVMGWHDTVMKLKMDLEGPEARMLNKQLFSIIWDEAVKASEQLAIEEGAFPAYKAIPEMPVPRRNSLLMAIAPTACQRETNRIQTSEGIKSLYEILEESGVDYK